MTPERRGWAVADRFRDLLVVGGSTQAFNDLVGAVAGQIRECLDAVEGGRGVRNVYTVRLAVPVKTEPSAHHFTGKESSWLYVVATSFPAAEEAVRRKYPDAEVRGIELMNYRGIPIVMGE